MTAPSSARPRAAITGASSGIGAAFARRLAADGHDLLLVARRRDRLEALARELGERHGVASTVLAADLATEDGIRAAATALAGRSAPSFLVHSAGFGTRALFAELDPALPRAMNLLHVVAPVELARAALPGMLAAGRGRILLISSLGGFFTTARYTTYSATKAYLNMFAEGLQAELEGTGVRVQAICPGLTRTGFLDTPAYAEFKYQDVPASFWMTAEEVVEQALASRATIFVPGRHNRLLVHAIRAPLLGPALRRLLRVANRKGLY